MRSTQVLVVGAGPVGLALAGELRLGGAQVEVVEQRATPMTESRASTVHALSAELLDQRGLLTALGPPDPVRTRHFAGLPLDLGDVPSPRAGVWKVPQTRLEAVLTGWVHGLGAVVRRGTALRSLRQDADGVEARLEGPSGPETVRADYVVGCDGQDSTVARVGGFDLAGTGPQRHLLRADLTGVDVPTRRFERHPRGLAVSATDPSGLTRIMVHRRNWGPANDAGPPAPDDIIDAWHDVTGDDLSGARVVWADRFDDTCLHATRYRNGRILLAGDAAHRQMPVGGQALNLGLHDAFNLGWKLAAHVTGRAPDWLLDSYDEERRPEAARTLALIRAQTLLLLGGPEVEPLRTLLAELMAYPAVRRQLALRISGLHIRYGSPTPPDPAVGRRLPPDLLGPADQERLRTLLATGRGVLLDRGKAGWLLLRPDGYTAAAGTADTDPAPELARWFPADPRPVPTLTTGQEDSHGQM